MNDIRHREIVLFNNDDDDDDYGGGDVNIVINIGPPPSPNNAHFDS